MSSDRFHKAAKDGLLDVLKEATRRDANVKDNDGMTPVLWAAFEGKLDALRLLCGRGGDPDKCDQFGNTALHLASAKGHLSSVDFLVKFGVNIYALDIDKHSAKDLAAINNRDDILRYLDSAAASLEASDRKKARSLRELAEKNCEKRMREYVKRQQKLENDCSDLKPQPTSQKPSNMLAAIKQKIWSSQGNLHKPPRECHSFGTLNSAKFSDLIGSASASSGGSVASRTTIQRKLAPKLRSQSRSKDHGVGCSSFKIGEIEANGERSITSLSGLQRDSEILYVGAFPSSEDVGKRGKIVDVFEVEEVNSDAEQQVCKSGYGTLTRSFSQPDILANRESDEKITEELAVQRQVGIFDRPTLGSIAFRRSVTAALSQLHPEACSIDGSYNSALPTARNSKSRTGKLRTFLNMSDTDSDGGGFSDDDENDAGSPIQRFLTVWGLDEYLTIFQKQQIDLDTLMLLTEADIKSLSLPLGPFRKLTFAIQERRNALANPGCIQDSHL